MKATKKCKACARDDVTVLVVDAIPDVLGRSPVVLRRTTSSMSSSSANCSSNGQEMSENVLVWSPLDANKGPATKWMERVRWAALQYLVSIGGVS